MPRASLLIAGGLAVSLAFTVQSASAQTAEEGKAQAAPYLSDTETIMGTSDQVLGSVVDGKDLTSGATDVGVPYGDGFSAEEWELDDSVSKPVFAMANRALVAKGKPTLEQRGVDTGMINNGMSLDAAQTNVGTMNASIPTNAVMGTVGSLVGGLIPVR